MYDNLNRMTNSPKLTGGTGSIGWTYTNDILGNRLDRNLVWGGAGSTRYTWDILNRMLVCANTSSGGKSLALMARDEMESEPYVFFVSPLPCAGLVTGLSFAEFVKSLNFESDAF